MLGCLRIEQQALTIHEVICPFPSSFGALPPAMLLAPWLMTPAFTHRGELQSSISLMSGSGSGIPPKGLDDYDEPADPADGLNNEVFDTTDSSKSGDIETGAVGSDGGRVTLVPSLNVADLAHGVVPIVVSVSGADDV